MKKFLVGACVLLLAGTGCNGGDTTLTPGSTDDPSFQIFMEEFGNIDDGTGVMVQSMFDMMDGVFNANPRTRPTRPGSTRSPWTTTTRARSGSEPSRPPTPSPGPGYP